MNMDRLLENAIEITRLYHEMADEKIFTPVENLDRAEFNNTIIKLSKDFEEIFKDVDFNETALDYYGEIESFAAQAFLAREHMVTKSENKGYGGNR